MGEFFSISASDVERAAAGVARDDVGRFLPLQQVSQHPLQLSDHSGGGTLVRTAVELGRAARPDLHVRLSRPSACLPFWTSSGSC